MKRKIWITFAVSAMMVVATMTLATTGKLLRAQENKQENKEDTAEQQKNSISAQDLKAPNLHVVCVESELPYEAGFGWVVSYAWDEVSGADQSITWKVTCNGTMAPQRKRVWFSPLLLAKEKKAKQ